MEKPKRYRARKKDSGEWVEGWYVELHHPIEEVDHTSNALIVKGYEVSPQIFCDDPGHREGCHWHIIDPNTLLPANSQPQQLTLF